MDKKQVLIFLFLPIVWFFYQFFFGILFWSQYDPMSIILAHFQEFIRNHEQLYFVMLGLHDVLINIVISLPFAYAATKLIKTDLLKPLLFAAIVVFVFMHWHMIRNLLLFAGNDIVYRIIIIVGYAVQLPLAYGCIRFFQQRASA